MNSATTSANQHKLPSLPMLGTEQFGCPQCEGLIPSHHVFSRYDFEDGVQRRITIYCGHCRVYHERVFELRAGIWSPTGNPEIVTSRKRLAALKKVVDRIANVQLAQCA